MRHRKALWIDIRAWTGAAMAAVALTMAHGVAAQPYPNAPIRLIVPYPPAGATDITSRQLAERIGAQSGWQFVVDNRPGAGGNIGLDLLAKAKPDGYTLAMGQTSNLAINPTLYGTLPYDALKDIAPIALVASQPVVFVVRADSPWRTLADLVAAGKAKPAGLAMASAGTGTVGHLAGELFARRAGLALTHVPYKGAGPALTDLMGGQTEFMLPTPQAALPLVRGGKLRALAVTSAKRVAVLPDVPTVAESGYPGFEAVDWKVLVAPAGTSPELIRRINEQVDTALAKPEMADRLLQEGSAPMGGTPQQAADLIRAEHARWGAIVREAKIRPD